MNLRHLKKSWDSLGKDDPFYAILCEKEKRGRKWDEKEFFNTGEKEIDNIMKRISSLVGDMSHERALDFGCGVGRLTQPLNNHFKQVYGVDIAPSMIHHAEQYNKHPDTCTYLVNTSHNLARFSDNYFDFIITKITLQHMKPKYAKQYIKEFVRILKPQGVLVFQLTSEPKNAPAPSSSSFRNRIKQLIPSFVRAYIRKLRSNDAGIIEMHGIPKKDVLSLLQETNARVIDAQPDTSARKWNSFEYIVTKE